MFLKVFGDMCWMLDPSFLNSKKRKKNFKYQKEKGKNAFFYIVKDDYLFIYY